MHPCILYAFNPAMQYKEIKKIRLLCSFIINTFFMEQYVLIKNDSDMKSVSDDV